MNKLRSNQIFAVLLGSAAFPLLCRTEPFTIEGIFGAAIATAVQLLLCIPILLLYRTGFCFGECARRHRILPLCFIVYLLFRGGTSFVQLQQTSQEISLPFSEKFLAAALIALVCLYTVSLGIQTIARSSTMILGILLITLTIMCIGAIPQAEPQNLALSPNDTIWKGFFRSMTTADELPLLFLLLDFSEKKTYRSIVPVWVGKFLLGSYLSVLGMAVLGSRMAKASHPFFAIVSVSQPLSTQRADALYILVFVMLCVLRITLFAVLAAHLLSEAALHQYPLSAVYAGHCGGSFKNFCFRYLGVLIRFCCWQRPKGGTVSYEIYHCISGWIDCGSPAALHRLCRHPSAGQGISTGNRTAIS